jgi:quinolinate synthase
VRSLWYLSGELAMSLMSNSSSMPSLATQIDALRREMNAVILAHYYQEDEIQDVADFIGDSLELSKKAAATDADVIVFCGVRFMAEVAKILNPGKLVLVPDLKAGCSLEDSCKPEAFKAFRAKHPDHLALTYINCSAEVKALSDIIVTSSSAEKIIHSIPTSQPILFAPDRHLGAYLNKRTGREMLLWPGSCVVHENFSERELIRLQTQHPQAKIIAHPECPEAILRYADHIGSTSSLLRYTEAHPGQEYIVLTEPGIIHQMQRLSPGSQFYDVPSMQQAGCTLCSTCPYMRLNTLEKLYACMRDRTPALMMSPELLERAAKPLEAMMERS